MPKSCYLVRGKTRNALSVGALSLFLNFFLEPHTKIEAAIILLYTNQF